MTRPRRPWLTWLAAGAGALAVLVGVLAAWSRSVEAPAASELERRREEPSSGRLPFEGFRDHAGIEWERYAILGGVGGLAGALLVAWRGRHRRRRARGRRAAAVIRVFD